MMERIAAQLGVTLNELRAAGAEQWTEQAADLRRAHRRVRGGADPPRRRARPDEIDQYRAPAGRPPLAPAPRRARARVPRSKRPELDHVGARLAGLPRERRFAVLQGHRSARLRLEPRRPRPRLLPRARRPSPPSARASAAPALRVKRRRGLPGRRTAGTLRAHAGSRAERRVRQPAWPRSIASSCSASPRQASPPLAARSSSACRSDTCPDAHEALVTAAVRQPGPRCGWCSRRSTCSAGSTCHPAAPSPRPAGSARPPSPPSCGCSTSWSSPP